MAKIRPPYYYFYTARGTRRFKNRATAMADAQKCANDWLSSVLVMGRGVPDPGYVKPTRKFGERNPARVIPRRWTSCQVMRTARGQVKVKLAGTVRQRSGGR
jgi:hypothetical protein